MNEKRLGVYFDKNDYAGFWVRLGAWIIDSIIVMLFSSICWFIVDKLSDNPLISFRITFFSSLIFMYLYLAISKVSKFKTIGYNLFSIRVVDLFGNKPQWHTMLLRFFLIFIGPFSFVTDLLWITGEHTRQTLRDKYSGTYVIKNNAIPKGYGILKTIYLHFMGWNLSFLEVSI